MGATNLGLGPASRSGAPEGFDFDFVTGRFWRAGRRLGAPDEALEWTFARASTAWDEGADTLLVEHVADVPRLGRGGFLLEGAATNLLSRSAVFEDPAWIGIALGAGSAPVVLGPATDPAGGMTARRLVFDRGAGDVSGDLSFASHVDFASTPGRRHVGSVWVRSDDPTTLLMRHVGAAAYLVMAVDATWRRFQVSSTAPAEASNFQIGLRGGVGVSRMATVDVWNAQCEVDLATSDVVTGAAVATRAADELEFGHPATETGAVVMELIPAEVAGTRILFEGAGLRVSMLDGVVSATLEGDILAAGGAASAGQVMRVAVAWEPGRVSLAMNGSVASGLGELVSGALTVGRGAGEPFFGRLRRWRRLDRALSDAALAAVTS